MKRSPQASGGARLVGEGGGAGADGAGGGAEAGADGGGGGEGRDGGGDRAGTPLGRSSYDEGSVRGGTAHGPSGDGAGDRGGGGGAGEGDPDPHLLGQPMTKLPYGISAVRPHIAQVDNVPLLVSLFSDAAPDATREMIGILQEHGEVVLCIGSSANVHNAAAFAQASQGPASRRPWFCQLSDVAAAIDPVPPYVCVRGDRVRPAPGPGDGRGAAAARWRVAAFGRDTTGARLGARLAAAARRLFGAGRRSGSKRLTVSASAPPSTGRPPGTASAPAGPAARPRTAPLPRSSSAPRAPPPAAGPPEATRRWRRPRGGALQWEGGDVCAARVTRVEEFGRALSTLACPLLMRRDTNLSEVLDLLAEGRRLLNNTRQALLLFLAAHLQLFFVVLASQCLLFPAIYTGYQILWLELVQFPLLAASLLACPMEQNIMRRMADKNSSDLAHWRRYAAYFAARAHPPRPAPAPAPAPAPGALQLVISFERERGRCLPPACLVLFAFAWALAGSGRAPIPAPPPPPRPPSPLTPYPPGELGYQWGLLRAQNAALFYHVVYLAVPPPPPRLPCPARVLAGLRGVASASFQHRTASLREVRPRPRPRPRPCREPEAAG
eukprot:tig00000632_g2749.t1